MNFFDAIILLPLIYGAWKGFQKGLIYEVAMIIGLILGVYLGFKFSGLVFDLLSNLIDDEGHLLHYIFILYCFWCHPGDLHFLCKADGGGT